MPSSPPKSPQPGVNRIASGRRPDREGGAHAGRFRGRARPRLGRPLSEALVAAGDRGARSVTLFVGTERGFTYRLTLTPSDRDGSAQILIRNAEALPGGRRNCRRRSSDEVRSPRRGAGAAGARRRPPRSAAGLRRPSGRRNPFQPVSGSSRPGGVRSLRRSSSRPHVRHPTVRTGPRASPGPIGRLPGIGPVAALLAGAAGRRPLGRPARRGGGRGRRRGRPAMNARPDRRPAGDANDADAVRRRQLLLFSVIAAVALVALAAWLGHGRQQDRCAAGRHRRRDRGAGRRRGWSGRGARRRGSTRSRTRLRRMEQEAGRAAHRKRRAPGRSWRARRPTRSRTIDAQKAQIDELERRLQPAAPGGAPGNASEGDPWFRGPGAGAVWRRSAAAGRFGGLAHDRDLRAGGRAAGLLSTTPRSGPELVADAVAKPVSVWLPAGAPCRGRGAGRRRRPRPACPSQGDPRPVLLRITGPPGRRRRTGPPCRWMSTAAPSPARRHGDLSSEKVYVRFRTMTCAGPEAGTVIETDVAGFVAGSGKTGVRGPVVSREGALVEKAFLRRAGLGSRPGRQPGVPAAGGRDRRRRGGRQHRARRHRPRGPRRGGLDRRAEGRRLHDPPGRAVPAGDPAPGRHEGDAGVSSRAPASTGAAPS